MNSLQARKFKVDIRVGQKHRGSKINNPKVHWFVSRSHFALTMIVRINTNARCGNSNVEQLIRNIRRKAFFVAMQTGMRGRSVGRSAIPGDDAMKTVGDWERLRIEAFLVR